MIKAILNSTYELGNSNNVHTISYDDIFYFLFFFDFFSVAKHAHRKLCCEFFSFSFFGDINNIVKLIIISLSLKMLSMMMIIDNYFGANHLND